MDEVRYENLLNYATKHGMGLLEDLGDGVHGTVFLAENHGKSVIVALKGFSDAAAFERECAVYGRLAEHGVTEICGHFVPQFLRADDELMVIEMTVVSRPFVLDFASTWLDWPPTFSPEALAYHDREMREKFGARYQVVQQILEGLEEMGIFQMDVNPGNVGFREE